MNRALKEVMFGDFRRVSYVFRFSSLPVQNRENVAEHSWWTAMIAMTIAAELEGGDEGSVHDLMAEVAMRAIMHDVEEIGTGDLVREAKYFDAKMREDFRRVEVAFADRLFGKLGSPTSHIMKHLWATSKDFTLAGNIVALADLLSVIAYCRHEASMGNTNLAEVETACRLLAHEKFDGNKTLNRFLEGI